MSWSRSAEVGSVLCTPEAVWLGESEVTEQYLHKPACPRRLAPNAKTKGEAVAGLETAEDPGSPVPSEGMSTAGWARTSV